MTLTADAIMERALDLPRESRALLAERLLGSLDDAGENEVSEAWRAEIRRRSKEIDEGVVKLVPAEQVFAELDREMG